MICSSTVNRRRSWGAMIDMGHNLDHEIIAEGVETLEQYQMLQKLGCEMAQGYLLSKPVSADSIAKLLDIKGLNHLISA
ncbi:EAL domain-containing protein [Acaryochloris sp. 'Moss Beach']|uniref:EAL domain-containing protein n=1 Tax=Acaryochloris sp. 'Moss Beach' TaxID=2740837 RepID=UPI0037C00CB3